MNSDALHKPTQHKDIFNTAWVLSFIGLILLPLTLLSLFSPLFILAAFYYWYLFYRSHNLDHPTIKGSHLFNFLLSLLLVFSLCLFAILFSEMALASLRTPKPIMTMMADIFSPSLWDALGGCVALSIILTHSFHKHLAPKEYLKVVLAPWSVVIALAAFFYFLKGLLPLSA